MSQFDFDQKIICKTTTSQGWKLIPAMLFVGHAFLAGLYIAIFENFRDDPTGIYKIIIILLMIVGLYWMVIRLLISWFFAAYEVEFDGNRLIGYNFFGRRKEIKVRDIVEFRKRHLPAAFYFEDSNGVKFEINLAIDFYGFIMDKIINLAKVKTPIKGEFIKMRNCASFWRYSRFKPFNTEYPAGYLEWLRPQIRKQLGELQAKGILAKDQDYIIEEPENEWKNLQESQKEKRIQKEKRRNEWANRSDI